MNKINITDTDYRLAEIFKALGNPTRLAIIRKLMEKCNCPHGSDPCTCGARCDGKHCECGCKCGEIVDFFTMSQSTISQHIKALKKAGLIETRGRKDDYIISHQNLKEAMNALTDIIS